MGGVASPACRTIRGHHLRAPHHRTGFVGAVGSLADRCVPALHRADRVVR